MTNSLTTEKGQASNMEKKTRELQTKIDMMNIVEQVGILVLFGSLIRVGPIGTFYG